MIASVLSLVLSFTAVTDPVVTTVEVNKVPVLSVTPPDLAGIQTEYTSNGARFTDASVDLVFKVYYATPARHPSCEAINSFVATQKELSSFADSEFAVRVDTNVNEERCRGDWSRIQRTNNKVVDSRKGVVMTKIFRKGDNSSRSAEVTFAASWPAKIDKDAKRLFEIFVAGATVDFDR